MLNDPYPSQDFDEWAASYDASVMRNSGFPFDGYRQVHECILSQAQARPGMSVLDLGCGSGNLALLFAEQGCQLWCSDFSPAMLRLAQAKLPGAQFVLADLRAAWPAALERRFDRIVSAYVFHHFELEEKVRLLSMLVEKHLSPHGRVVIGDIAFQDRAAWEAARANAGDEWEEELYWDAGLALPALRAAGLMAHFIQVSQYGGVFTLYRM